VYTLHVSNKEHYINQACIVIVSLGLLFSGAAPAFADVKPLEGCAIEIPSTSKEGELMVVFARGAEGTNATDWKDDGGGQGWKQLGFDAITNGRDTATAVFYKRNNGNEKIRFLQ